VDNPVDFVDKLLEGLTIFCTTRWVDKKKNLSFQNSERLLVIFNRNSLHFPASLEII